MTTKSMMFVASILLAGLLAACNNAPEVAKESNATPAALASPSAAKELAKPDYSAIAQKIVAQSAGVKEGDIVQISGEIKDADLLQEIALEVRKLGAFPLLQMSSDNPERSPGNLVCRLLQPVSPQADEKAIW